MSKQSGRPVFAPSTAKGDGDLRGHPSSEMDRRLQVAAKDLATQTCDNRGVTNKAQGIGGLVIAAAYVVYHFAQPRHGGAYGQGEIVGTIAMVVTFGGFGLYKLLKR
jgi:hypothetical protein